MSSIDNSQEDTQERKPKGKAGQVIALKDWHIFCPPEHDIHIKKGDDVSKIPPLFLENLKTEGVI